MNLQNKNKTTINDEGPLGNLRGEEGRDETTSVDSTLLGPSRNREGVERRVENTEVDSSLAGPSGNPRKEAPNLTQLDPPGDPNAGKQGPSRDLETNSFKNPHLQPGPSRNRGREGEVKEDRPAATTDAVNSLTDYVGKIRINKRLSGAARRKHNKERQSSDRGPLAQGTGQAKPRTSGANWRLKRYQEQPGTSKVSWGQPGTSGDSHAGTQKPGTDRKQTGTLQGNRERPGMPREQKAGKRSRTSPEPKTSGLTPENARKKPRGTPIPATYAEAADNKIRVAIVHRNREEEITREQEALVSEGASDLILNIPKGQFRPGFDECFIQKGVLRMTCSNKESEQWLREIVPTLRKWQGCDLEVVGSNELPKYVKVKAVIPENGVVSTERLLQQLENQTPQLHTKKWIVHDSIKENDRYRLIMSVDEDSVKVLREMGMTAHVGIRKATFMVRGPNTDERI